MLAVAPLVWVGVFLLVGSALASEGARAIALRAEVESIKALGFVGCVLAASAFERGDYLRRAWGLHALCFGLLLLRDALFLLFVSDAKLFGLPYAAVQAALVLVANGGAVIGTFMIARAWQVAGIELPFSRLMRGGLIGGAAALSLAITASATLADLERLSGGDVGALVGLASDLGDILSMTLLAPVLLTALALRGGRLTWPWALLTASLFAWLLYDANAAFGHLTLSASGQRLTGEIWRALACGYAFAAGVAQRWVLTEPHPKAPALRAA